MKILTIVGARPQFVKAAVLSRIIASRDGVEEILVHTGQHYDANMSDIFFEEMEIPKPKYNLDVNSLSHGAMTGRMLEKIEEVLTIEKPDLLLVYGDTNSTLAGALAAKKMHIPVAHVEAGLRSFNMQMPEEINRILTDRISDFLFCPTQAAIDNLKAEGFDNFENQYFLSGDVMQDAALFYKNKAHVSSESIQKLGDEPFVLCTIHRQENTDHPERLKAIVAALNEINETKKVVMTVHPRTKKIMENSGLQINFTCIDPVGYLDMILLLQKCDLVMTDSGGLQKEAYFFHKPCITLRDQTEWVELVENGFNSVVGVDSKLIQEAYTHFASANLNFEKELYGGGSAGVNMINTLLASFAQ
jgi:UDP-GlcNAc3NAcA epimerase